MDHVYGHFNNNASPKIHIRQYFDEYLKEIVSAGCFIPSTKDDKDVFDMMGVELGEEEKSMLTKYCSVDNLTVQGEMPKLTNKRKMRRRDVFDPQEPPDVNLQTVQFLKRRLKMNAKKPNYKYKGELFINHKKEMPTKEAAVPGGDIVVLLRIYSPFKNRLKHEPYIQMGSHLLLSNVTAVLGSQTLAEVRDQISCIADYSISKECSDNPDKPLGPMAKDVYKSGFFYIENTFYNDTRHPLNIDYSKVIMEWAERRPQLGPFHADFMETCRIDTLCVRFGFPWVYKHQGGCEHLIVFSDARFINSDDELVKSAYPRIVRIKPKSSRLCMICGLYVTQWITIDNDRIPHNPCFFCNSCFRSYNYINKKKVGNFLAFPYPRNVERAKSVIKK